MEGVRPEKDCGTPASKVLYTKEYEETKITDHRDYFSLMIYNTFYSTVRKRNIGLQSDPLLNVLLHDVGASLKKTK